jgi:hypothetical protein
MLENLLSILFISAAVCIPALLLLGGLHYALMDRPSKGKATPVLVPVKKNLESVKDKGRAPECGVEDNKLVSFNEWAAKNPPVEKTPEPLILKLTKRQKDLQRLQFSLQSDSRDFNKILNSALSLNVVTEQQIVEKTGRSPLAVSNWIKGNTRPKSSVQNLVYDWLEDLLAEKSSKR